MDKDEGLVKERLLRSLLELQNAHDRASKKLAAILTIAAAKLNDGNDLPSISDLRRYKKAITDAKIHTLQVELIRSNFPTPPSNTGSLGTSIG